MCGFFADFKRRNAASTDTPRAPADLNEMGKRYESGNGLPKDVSAAYRCYRESSLGGHPEGTFNLGRVTMLGLGIQANRLAGLALIERAASEGCLEAIRFLGMGYYRGEVLPRDRTKAFPYLKKLADKGDRDSAYLVGMMYKSGDGVKFSPRDAYRYLDTAARLGHTQAGREIGGEPAVKAEPVKKAPVRPEPPKTSTPGREKYLLALRYLEGNGVGRSIPKALELLKSSADAGCTDAMITLGDTYASFSYGLHSDEKAIEHYADAAVHGRDEYVLKAVNIYRNAKSILFRDETFGHIRRYADSGRSGLYADLVRLYAEFDGKEPPPHKLGEWYQKATKAGLRTEYLTDTRFLSVPKVERKPPFQPETDVRTYRWKYPVPDGRGGTVKRTANLSLRIRYSDYSKLGGYKVERSIGGEKRRQFVTPKDPYVKVVADYITELTRNMPPMVRANCALKFAQSLRYTSDMEQFGKSDYAMFPLEMLWTQTGDCEDFAILFVSIMKAMGFDMALIRMKTGDGYHMASGLCHRDARGYMINHEGKKYCYCEATSTVSGDPEGKLWRVGEKPDGYEPVLVIPIF